MAANNSIFALLLLSCLILAQCAAGLSASSISGCPKLAARTSAPAGAHDLRPDDIKVVAAMGDSIMAGFALEGINDGQGGTGILNISSITEYRGQSWGIGGDSGAITLANFVQHYNSSVEGGAKGKQVAAICHGLLCLDALIVPKIAVLNAALSGAISMNLDDELDYLIPQMKKMKNINYQNDWKMITIQIGSNDQCASCLNPFRGEVTVAKYGAYVDAAVARIRKEVPRVIVNLVGSFNVSHVYELTHGEEYCRPLFSNPNALLNRVECSCFLQGDEERHNMDVLSAGYNVKLQEIYNKYKGQEATGFGIRYTPANINIGGFPLSIMSNVDCFHPGKLAHQWVAKIIWNNLFLPQKQISTDVFNYDANQQIYCPSESDRVRVD